MKLFIYVLIFLSARGKKLYYFEKNIFSKILFPSQQPILALAIAKIKI